MRVTEEKEEEKGGKTKARKEKGAVGRGGWCKVLETGIRWEQDPEGQGEREEEHRKRSRRREEGGGRRPLEASCRPQCWTV